MTTTLLFYNLGIVTDHTLGREVVTVNVNQINEDLIRQVGAVSNTVNPPASHSYLQGDIFFYTGMIIRETINDILKNHKIMIFQ